MKILHYFLGFPPMRTGGLVKYVIDLGNQQEKKGDKVCYLFPGSDNFSNEVQIIRVHSKKKYSEVYSIKNSLPIPLFGGISKPKEFMRSASTKTFKSFLQNLRPDIIHVHTLMGLHKEFMIAARELGIPLVYTTHDYFGLAPEPTFFYNHKNYYNSDDLVKDWEKISTTAMSIRKLKVLKSSIYVYLRYIYKLLPQKSKVHFTYHDNHIKSDAETYSDFSRLINYYKEMFSMITAFHFNSSLSKEIYSKFIKFSPESKILTISDSNVEIRKELEVNTSFRNKRKLNIGYIGPYKEYKGFFEFLKLTKVLSNKSYNFHIYGSNEKIKLPDHLINHGRYSKDQLTDILNRLDVLIVPSLWKETFGLVTVEALSSHVKTLVSRNVGAKDLVDSAFVFKNIGEVPSMLLNLNNYHFKKMKTMQQHVCEIGNLYNQLIKLRK